MPSPLRTWITEKWAAGQEVDNHYQDQTLLIMHKLTHKLTHKHLTAVTTCHLSIQHLDEDEDDEAGAQTTERAGDDSQGDIQRADE
mmetsp:Transcript_31329/g.42432  ORF Transcript_31329/g.42432 Transcript_31329/m.42432 type:complete len:86 (+) Transcript_31329:245-502(+)